jgi:hypothetical protein
MVGMQLYYETGISNITVNLKGRFAGHEEMGKCNL